jgi:glycine C-acetyltransferase
LECKVMSHSSLIPALEATLADLKTKGLFKRERQLQGKQGSAIHVGGAEVINFCANNYLGLANHPAIVEAAADGLKRFGYGLSSVRFICGTQDLHKQLESALARFLQKEDAILYTSCFDANGGLFETLLDEQDTILTDELNHASIIDGIRLCKAKRFRYRHADMAELEKGLQEAKGSRYRLIATDGVFSMDGDIGPVDKLADLAEKYGAIMMVDDAHASGVLGRNGRGSVDHFHATDKVDVQVGTLSKAIGALGGYVCGSRDLIDYLYHRARPFLFSTSHPPSVAATCIAAFDILESEPERIERLWANTAYFKQQLTNAGFDVGGNTTPKSETPITPIIIGDGRRTMDFSRALFDAGLMATGIAFPTVPEGKARIRTIMTSEHTRAEIDQALEIITSVAKKVGILKF